MARAELSQGRRNAFAGEVQISRQAQRFRKVRYRFRGRRRTFARSGADFVAGAILSEGQTDFAADAALLQGEGQIRTFARCGPDFAAGAALSQEVPISRQGT